MTAEEISKDIENRIEKALREAMHEVTFEIERAYENAIDAFYRHYSPIAYNRTYETYSASSYHKEGYKSHVKEIVKHGKIVGFTGGIIVDSENMSNDIYHDPTDYVFNRTYFYGIHGTIRTGGVMSMPPERIMQMSFEGITENLNRYVNKYMKKYFKR